MPKQHSSGGKDRFGHISKQGDRYLRGLFVAGALAVIRYAKIHGTTSAKRLRKRGRDLLHIVAKHGKLASNGVRRHPRFDANETGRQFASLDVMRPRETFSRNTMVPRASRPTM